MTVLAFALLLTNSCKKDDNSNNNNHNTKNVIIFNPNLKYDSLTDIDGNIYKTIKIGTQTWMAENLKVTHYRNGDPIPNVTSDTVWGNIYTGAYCNYLNNVSNDMIYGKLYNYFTTNNLCPVGWHIPNDDDWNILINYLGGDSIAGIKLKESTSTHWNNPNSGATNESGFTALPGGINGYGVFSNLGDYGYWWSTKDYMIFGTSYRALTNDSCNVESSFCHKTNGLSVRCIKDN